MAINKEIYVGIEQEETLEEFAMKLREKMEAMVTLAINANRLEGYEGLGYQDIVVIESALRKEFSLRKKAFPAQLMKAMAEARSCFDPRKEEEWKARRKGLGLASVLAGGLSTFWGGMDCRPRPFDNLIRLCARQRHFPVRGPIGIAVGLGLVMTGEYIRRSQRSEETQGTIATIAAQEAIQNGLDSWVKKAAKGGAC